ncbi:hypothetical protein B0F90DRAFT_1734100 [Multifurca ochricompacta]|uniref:ATP synthase F0 subunit 8 n=1 Tax=Multifurca ochricompacta TaxID=376703 RepID=A0AAD4QMC4_9AGAM|nr:hypothetical protein B0F90DRAFT_1734100 [Multifurca ochricompacta]
MSSSKPPQSPLWDAILLTVVLSLPIAWDLMAPPGSSKNEVPPAHPPRSASSLGRRTDRHPVSLPWAFLFPFLLPPAIPSLFPPLSLGTWPTHFHW